MAESVRPPEFIARLNDETVGDLRRAFGNFAVVVAIQIGYFEDVPESRLTIAEREYKVKEFTLSDLHGFAEESGIRKTDATNAFKRVYADAVKIGLAPIPSEHDSWRRDPLRLFLIPALVVGGFVTGEKHKELLMGYHSSRLTTFD